MAKTITENTVLLATAAWLGREGWQIHWLEAAGNKPTNEKNGMLEKLKKLGIPYREPRLTVADIVRFSGRSRPDLAAKKGTQWCIVECKGLRSYPVYDFGAGLFQTLEICHANAGREDTVAGFALPRVPEYLEFLRHDPIDRIRRQFGIWVFLYDDDCDDIKKAVTRVKPGDSIPSLPEPIRPFTKEPAQGGEPLPRPLRRGHQALEQTLGVIELVWHKGKALKEAAGTVAARSGIDRRSVIDKCTRQLGFVGKGAVDRFRELLDDHPRMIERLMNAYQNDRDLIRNRLHP
jgi:hypothetical protein